LSVRFNPNPAELTTGYKEHRGGIICSESARIDSSDPLLSEPTPVNLFHPVLLFKNPFSGSTRWIQQSRLYLGGAGHNVGSSFMSILMPILVAFHVIVCLLLVLVVLMQRPRSEGLGSAFGGGITDNVFGSQTTNVLARFTTWMAIGFFGITLLLSILTAKMNSGKTDIQKKLMSTPTPEASQPSVEEKTDDAAPAMGLQNAIQTPTPAPAATPAPVETAPAAATPAPTTPAPTAPAPTAPAPTAPAPTAPAPTAPAPTAPAPTAPAPTTPAPTAPAPAAPPAEPAQN
jgi:protein translocase SecG subunit